MNKEIIKHIDRNKQRSGILFHSVIISGCVGKTALREPDRLCRTYNSKNREPTAEKREPRAESRELKAENRESQELRAEKGEPRAES